MDLEEADDLQEEIKMMRVVTRRLLKMARSCKDTGEMVNVLGALGLAAGRLAEWLEAESHLPQ